MAQQQMGLVCVTAAEACVKSNSSAVGGDPAIPPPAASLLRGFPQSARPRQAWHYRRAAYTAPAIACHTKSVILKITKTFK